MVHINQLNPVLKKNSFYLKIKANSALNKYIYGKNILTHADINPLPLKSNLFLSLHCINKNKFRSTKEKQNKTKTKFAKRKN